HAELIGLIFLVPRETQSPQLGLLVDDVADRRATEDRTEDLAENAAVAALRILLADVRVVGGDMPCLMTEREGELRLVIHQRQQLASDVDVAAGDAHGVFDGGIERRVMKRLTGVSDARI